jgi:hypothetical protein
MILDFSRRTDQPLFLAEPIEQVRLPRDVALGEGSDINLCARLNESQESKDDESV